MVLIKELLHVYCLVINVHFYLLLFAHASALLDYHVSRTLSTAFFIFFKIFFITAKRNFRIHKDFKAEKEGFEPSRRY